jgi:hypothetical protein
MKSLRDEMEIVNAYELVGTYRGAATLCGTTAKTVKRVLERRSIGQVGRRPAPPRVRNTAAVTQLIADPGYAPLMVGSRPSGFWCSLEKTAMAARPGTSVGRWPQPRLPGRNSGGRYRPWVPVPGEHLVFDWATEAGWQVFCAVLAWSRYRFIRFATNQTQQTTLALLAECFEELGGVPAILLTDRMRCLWASTVANVVVPHPEFVQFCARYACRPDFCEAADPESKGMVQHLCGYAQTDLVIPALPDGGWPDLATANAAARNWCAEVNARVHSETYAVPSERLSSEREILCPLPSLRPPATVGMHRC